MKFTGFFLKLYFVRKLFFNLIIIFYSVFYTFQSSCIAQIEYEIASGRKIFHQMWRPISHELNNKGGLGPLYTRRSCSSCHIQNGRSRTPTFQNNLKEMSVKILIYDKNKKKNTEHPTLGSQLQDKGTFGIEPEGKISLIENNTFKLLPNGRLVTLTLPNYFLKESNFLSTKEPLILSPRISPPLFGLGYLEAIDEILIKYNADPNDKNNDGISGKYKKIYNIKQKKISIGRFGWKADQPDIFQQVALAFNKDLGLTNPIYPETNCPKIQENCKLFLNTSTIELGAKEIEKVTLYIKNIDMPKKLNLDKKLVKKGKSIFFDLKCHLCHIPSWKTSSSNKIKKLNDKQIFPYTDLLLHDMGNELADKSSNPIEENREWRTPALWGLASNEITLNNQKYLHDGRAKSIIEAILWHGGEALKSRKKFEKLDYEEQNNLIYFLKSL